MLGRLLAWRLEAGGLFLSIAAVEILFIYSFIERQTMQEINPSTPPDLYHDVSIHELKEVNSCQPLETFRLVGLVPAYLTLGTKAPT